MAMVFYFFLLNDLYRLYNNRFTKEYFFSKDLPENTFVDVQGSFFFSSSEVDQKGG